LLLLGKAIEVSIMAKSGGKSGGGKSGNGGHGGKGGGVVITPISCSAGFNFRVMPKWIAS
jgi:hypothetical protein